MELIPLIKVISNLAARGTYPNFHLNIHQTNQIIKLQMDHLQTINRYNIQKYISHLRVILPKSTWVRQNMTRVWLKAAE